MSPKFRPRGALPDQLPDQASACQQPHAVQTAARLYADLQGPADAAARHLVQAQDGLGRQEAGERRAWQQAFEHAAAAQPDLMTRLLGALWRLANDLRASELDETAPGYHPEDLEDTVEAFRLLLLRMPGVPWTAPVVTETAAEVRRLLAQRGDVPAGVADRWMRREPDPGVRGHLLRTLPASPAQLDAWITALGTARAEGLDVGDHLIPRHAALFGLAGRPDLTTAHRHTLAVQAASTLRPGLGVPTLRRLLSGPGGWERGAELLEAVPQGATAPEHATLLDRLRAPGAPDARARQRVAEVLVRRQAAGALAPQLSTADLRYWPDAIPDLQQVLSRPLIAGLLHSWSREDRLVLLARLRTPDPALAEGEAGGAPITQAPAPATRRRAP